MKDECLICGAPLKYLENDEQMECAVCHKKENSKTVCENGHYVCNDCHTRGMDIIIGVCLAEKSKDPIVIIKELMALPFCHMHGPEHHVLVGSGMFVSIVTGSTPLANEAWGLSNKMTSSALGAIGEVGGPRCCKRDSYLAIVKAVEFSKAYLGVGMELGEIKCTHSAQDNQCIGKRCPFLGK